MRSFEKFKVLVIVVFALSAIGTANASAYFTATATGSISGKALENQVLTFSGGKLECTTAATAGTISDTSSQLPHMTVNYSGCTAFGFATVDVSPATYQYTTAGNLHIENTITITPTFFGASMCTVTIGPQTVGTVDYANSGANNIKVTPTVSGIVYTSSGGSCGSSGSNGTYTGASELSRVGGGSIRFDS